MILVRAALLVLIVCLTSSALTAADSAEVERLRQELRQLHERFEALQKQHQEQINALSNRLEQLSTQQSSSAEEKQLAEELTAKLTPSTNAPVGQSGAAANVWSPSAPLTIARSGSAYMNISFDALVNAGWSTASEPAEFLQLGDHDPDRRGFSLRNAEIALDGAVDPYFKGFANVVFKLDRGNETGVELEETYLQTTALPYSLQLKGGQFLAGFGRQNSQHPHQWSFVDAPLILTRTFGPDGLRNVGVQGSWLVPTPWYTETSLGVFNGEGGTAFSFRNSGDYLLGADRVHGRSTSDRPVSGAEDLLYVPRVASSFDLSEDQTLLFGVSGAFGPNSTGRHTRTEIYGVDLYWKWKSPKANSGFPFVSWQTEALWQRFGASQDPTLGLAGENLRDWGFYSQVLWGFTQRWVAGLRGEYASGNRGAFDPSDVFRGERARVSPNLTFYPSEFSKLRIQYNLDQGEYFGSEHSVWLQAEFLLGAHGAHRF